MSKLAIAAIIPVYNRATVVLEAIDAVRDQSLPPCCLIVVDDGSTDETPSAVQKHLDQLALSFPTRLVRQDNQGPSVARNRGVDEACRLCAVDVLAFLDSNDLWPRDYLQRVAQSLCADKQLIACSADRLNVNFESGESELVRWNHIGEATTRRFLKFGTPGTPNTAFRLDEFQRVGGYDPAFLRGEDQHLLLKLSLRGGWAHLPGDPITVRRRLVETLGEDQQNSIRNAANRLSLAQMFEQFFLREGGREVLPERVWRRRLGRAWLTAGRQLEKLGRRDEARECFRKAIEVNSRLLKARLKLWLIGADRSNATSHRHDPSTQ